MILGLDLSLVETGLVKLYPSDNHNYLFSLIKTEAHQFNSEFERICFILHQISEHTLHPLMPDLVVIEGLSFGSKNTRSLTSLAKLHFAIENHLVIYNIRYEFVPPSTLKKHITGKGNAKKEVMLLKIYKKYGIEFSNHNIADAYALAKYGEEVILNRNTKSEE